MKKLFLLFMFFVVLYSVGASQIMFYEFDESSSPYSDSEGGTNAIAVSSVVSGHNTNALRFSNGTSEMTIFNQGYLNLDEDVSFCTQFWLNKVSNPLSTDYLLRFPYNTSGSQFVLRLYIESTGNFVYKLSKDGVVDYAIDTNGDIGTGWQLVTINYNASNTVMDLYLNGTFQSSDTFDQTTTSSTGLVNLWFNEFIAGRDFTYEIDEIRIYNDTCTQSDINTALNYLGSNISYSLNLVSNLTNTINYNNPDISFGYSGTLGGSNTHNDFLCSLVSNSVSNQTINVSDITKQQSFNYTFSELEGNFSFSINCSNDESFDSTSIFYYAFDTIIPNIVSDLVNHTQFIQNYATQFNINTSDTNLFADNISIINSLNQVIYNSYTENITTTSHNTLITLNNSNIGNFSVLVSVWDSHTLKIQIPYFWEKITETNNNKTYKGINFNYGAIKLLTDNYNLMNGFGLIKKTDRYIMVFNYTTLDETTLYMTGNKRILPINDNYDCHFIIGNKHWIDWVSNDITGLSCTYKENFNAWQIKFTPLKYKVTFRSIGDLNFNQAEYFYTVTSEDIILLQQIQSDVKETKEETQMFWVIIFIVSMLIVGILTKLWILWSFSGAGFLFLWLKIGEQYISSGLASDKIMTFGTLIFAIIFFLLGIILHLLKIIEEKRDTKKDFYNIGY